MNGNLNIDSMGAKKFNLMISPEILKGKFMEIKCHEKIKLEKKEFHEIKKNLNKLIKQYNLKKFKVKPQTKL